MNGDERRRLELNHPELVPTAQQIKELRESVTDIISISKCITMSFMILFGIIVAVVATRYHGWTGFYISFFGLMLDILIGMLLAYNIGQKTQRLFELKVILCKKV